MARMIPPSNLMMELGRPRRRERCTTASVRTLRRAGGRRNEALLDTTPWSRQGLAGGVGRLAKIGLRRSVYIVRLS